MQTHYYGVVKLGKEKKSIKSNKRKTFDDLTELPINFGCQHKHKKHMKNNNLNMEISFRF